MKVDVWDEKEDKKIKKKKRKIKKKVKIIILLLFLIIMIGSLVYLVFYMKDDKPSKEDEYVEDVVQEVVEEVDIYKLSDNATKYQKELFDDLKTLLETESYKDEDLVRILSKSFITDFYTLSNVTSKTPISLQYVPDALKDRFSVFASDIYDFYLYYDERDTMWVTNVEITGIKAITYTYSDDAGIVPDKKGMPGYTVTASWEYKNGDKHTTVLKIVKWDDHYGVVSVQN